MMRGELLCWDGRRIRLPDAVEWRFQYGCGTPCDSFQLTCLWEPDSGNDLAEAVSFTAEENGERLFTGVVDECERGWDTAGGTLTVAGRGMAARLLDNEALGADYQVATVEDILRDHVAPYGIETVRGAELPPVPGFSVDAGSSEWQVLYSFARYHGGVQPRFDAYGSLTVAAEEPGRVAVDDRTGVTAVSWRDKRYGVWSEVLVQDRGSLSPQRMVNEGFLRQGGRCRRVMTMPGRSAYQAMRYSGQFQLDRSYEERFTLELTVPGAYFCEPGDRVAVALSRPALAGTWTVGETEAVLDGGGSRVKLKLR